MTFRFRDAQICHFSGLGYSLIEIGGTAYRLSFASFKRHIVFADVHSNALEKKAMFEAIPSPRHGDTVLLICPSPRF